jgi:hypothetical protein
MSNPAPSRGARSASTPRGDHAVGAGRPGGVKADRNHPRAGHAGVLEAVFILVDERANRDMRPSSTRLGASSIRSTRNGPSRSRMVTLLALPPLSIPTRTPAAVVQRSPS